MKRLGDELVVGKVDGELDASSFLEASSKSVTSTGAKTANY
jgi:hypothetical protein